jgi:hypothetical protein
MNVHSLIHEPTTEKLLDLAAAYPAATRVLRQLERLVDLRELQQLVESGSRRGIQSP